MTDNTELKRLVDRVLTDRRFCGDENHKTLADGVLALITENEHLAMCARQWEEAAMQWAAERDQLKAENEALESSRAKLAGELSRLRVKHKDWSVNAAMGNGEQP